MEAVVEAQEEEVLLVEGLVRLPLRWPSSLSLGLSSAADGSIMRRGESQDSCFLEIVKGIKGRGIPTGQSSCGLDSPMKEKVLIRLKGWPTLQWISSGAGCSSSLQGSYCRAQQGKGEDSLDGLDTGVVVNARRQIL